MTPITSPQKRRFPVVLLSIVGSGVAIAHALRLPLLLFAAVGSGLSAGIFFAFSTFVMAALGQQPPAAGIAAMQAINITVINPWFMAAFFGPALVGLGWGAVALHHLDQPGALYGLAAAVIYLVGTLGVTIVGNIPLNDALAAVHPHSGAAATLWTSYLRDWTLWNHVRTAAAAIAAALFTLALTQR